MGRLFKLVVEVGNQTEILWGYEPRVADLGIDQVRQTAGDDSCRNQPVGDTLAFRAHHSVSERRTSRGTECWLSIAKNAARRAPVHVIVPRVLWVAAQSTMRLSVDRRVGCGRQPSNSRQEEKRW